MALCTSAIRTIAAIAALAAPLFGRKVSQAAASLHQSHMQLHVYIFD